MENGKIFVKKSKKGHLFGEIEYKKDKEKQGKLPFPSEFILEEVYNGKDLQMERVKGKITKLWIDGKEIQKKKQSFHSNQNTNRRYDKNSSDKTKKTSNNSTIISDSSTSNISLPVSSKGNDKFLNPYNFIDVTGKTPKYAFRGNDKFHENSGFIDVELETVTPLFIPDPEKTQVDTRDHKTMKFFRVNDKPYIPSTSLKGMFRNIVETISNSCFPHDYSKNKTLNYFSERLDVGNPVDGKEIRYLKPGVLKKNIDHWEFVELDQAKVLTVVDKYDKNKAIYYAKNNKGEIEKISIKTENKESSGIEKYIDKKKNRHFSIEKVTNLISEDFHIIGVNDKDIDKVINQYNKKFPYIDLNNKEIINKNNLVPLFYAIIRKNNKHGGLYKIKEISNNIEELNQRLNGYQNSERLKSEISYAVCQVALKTSFDIDTKTQDKLFFKFEQTDIQKYIKNKNGRQLDDKIIKRFRNLISQRYENLKKDYEKDSLLEIQPNNKFNGMPVFYSTKNDGYLTYTQIPRKPFVNGVAELIDNLGKEKCKSIDELCPACNIFGATNIKDNENNVSIGGKISIGIGKVSNGNFEQTTLKPLSEPKPSFYQFYILNNRKSQKKDGGKIDYNNFGKIGRKVYLFHNKDDLDYRAKEPNNLNSTVELLKPGSKINFSIRYFNLSNYELGLILQALNLRYKSERLDFQLGLGKPLGLGRVKLNSININEVNRKKRYDTLLDVKMGEENMGNDKMEKFINLFQSVQKDRRKEEFEFDPDGLNRIENIDDYSIKDISGFEKLLYIEEFKLLRSLNSTIELKDLKIKYPTTKDPSGEDKGFKWFMEYKKYGDQRLFKPEMLKDIDSNEVDLPLFNWG